MFSKKIKKGPRLIPEKNNLVVCDMFRKFNICERQRRIRKVKQYANS